MANTNDEINLTDLVSVDVLQRMQDAFTQMTGIAAQISDKNGVPITNGSGFSDFCSKHIKSSEKGRKGCEMCRRIGAETALKTGKVCEYRCHAGLVDFAAPIMTGKCMVGCISGGQVLLEKPDEQRMRKRAGELGLDPDELAKALQKVEYRTPEDVHKAAEAIYNIANIFSDLAFSSYTRNMQNIELERASHMKSDFLANMSHEIRTPMNAVIGMAEMVLREDLSPAARDYVKQIKSSGQALLTIINDILDFSKIEAGQMDINEIEYEPMTLFNDMVNIIITRIGNKKLELTMDVTPELPYELYGDNIRIKQILVNIANNAVKFTQEGCVHLKVDFEEMEDDMIELHVSVSDTGIGIKEADKAKLFQSFQQVDSKRNRNVEGTGLGLAICKQLLTLMNGRIQVDSVYGEGSTFSFTLPQKVVKKKPSIEKLEEKTVVAGLLQNSYVAEEMEIDMPRLGIEYFRIESEKDLPELIERGVTHLFVEHSLFTDTVVDFLKENVMMTGVVIVGYRSMRTYDDIPNVRIVKKPIYSLNLAGVFNGDDVYENFIRTEDDNFDFVAPDAEILVVDDNAINLTVARGLLEPLNMKIDTALSGKEAVDMVAGKRYDIVFMDHMMPGMDGVETTRVIRRMITGENGKVPIIALTANAVDGTKEMFLSEGMNDFVAKPIELRVMAAKLRQWLPEDKILKKKAGEGEIKPAEGERIVIDGLDVEAALRLLGSPNLFWSVLKEYYRVIDKKYAMISEYEKNEQWTEYTIEVHALKSSSRQIGAMELASVAEQMEMAGKAKKADLIHETTPGMLEQYMHYKQILAPYFPEEESESGGNKKITKKKLLGFFEQMREAAENLDMDAMEETVQAMNEFSYEGEQKEYFQNLKTAVEDIDTEKCEEILLAWEKIL